MRNRNDRIMRDAMRSAKMMEIIFMKDGTRAQWSTMDKEFMTDVANAFARLCDRLERQLERYGSNNRI